MQADAGLLPTGRKRLPNRSVTLWASRAREDDMTSTSDTSSRSSSPEQPEQSEQQPEQPEQLAELGHGISICYQTLGDPADEAVLLIMGLGGPMTWWSPDFCRLLADAGLFVIRFDNRDIGHSSRVRGRVTRKRLAQAFFGRGPRPPYTLDDMASDGFGLLDHLGIDTAHVVGVSMGGMIAQTMALLRPERVRSLTSIMSTTGR